MNFIIQIVLFCCCFCILSIFSIYNVDKGIVIPIEEVLNVTRNSSL